MNTDKHRLVPRLRFPEFEGEWGAKLLGRQTEKVGSGITPSGGDKNYKIEGRPFIRSQNIGWGELILEDVVYIDEAMHSTFSGTEIKEDDVLLNITGASIGRCAVADLRIIGGNVNQHVCIIRAKLKELNSVFLNQFILSNLGQRQIDSFQAGGNREGLNFGQIRSFELPLPSTLKEQQKIADCLSTLDEVISAEGENLDALKAHKKGLMQQLFPAEGKTTPKRRFPEFEEAGEWRDSKLSQLLAALNAGVSVNSGDRPARSSEVGILKTSAVTNGIFEPTQNKVVYEENEIQRLKEAVCGDSIIISRMNTPALVGANAYIDSSFDNLFLPDRLWAAKPKPDSSMRFIAFMLGSGKTRAALSELATGTSGSMKNITKPDVLALQIFAPHLPEQQKIANCLTSLDELITAQSQKIETLKLHKKGMMQQLFPSSEEVSQ